MPRPPVKKTEKLAMAQRKGELRAEYYMHKHKPLAESAREHIGKLIDRIDPIEIGAVIGVTILVHGTIVETEALLKAVASVKTNVAGNILAGLINPEAELIQWIAGTFAGSTSDVIKQFGLDQDWEIWLISYSIAYILVHHFGQILAIAGSGVSSLTGLIAKLLPAAASVA